ncbi:MAG: nucleoside recognition domain-containing protein [Acutalibacteraceae bacterium]
MLNYIWGAMMIISVVCGAINGKLADVSQAALDGAAQAVELLITMLGMMCFWSGLMNISDAGGATKLLSKALSPILSRLFPNYNEGDSTLQAICANITANFLGLGNSATPLGLRAMKEMQKHNKNKSIADNSMIRFVVLNTASIQLVPTFVSVIRKSYGAQSPLDILPCVLVSSAVGVAVGLSACFMFERGSKHG